MIRKEVLVDDELAYTVKYGNNIIRLDKKFKFIDTFNIKTGFSLTSNTLKDMDYGAIIDRMNNKEKAIALYNSIMTEDRTIFDDKEPFMRSMASLLDVGIMGNCKVANECTANCYQNAHKHTKRPNMTLEFYKKVIDEVKGHVFSVALGGSGDPIHHENFYDILKYSRDNNIIPSYTTSGYGLTEEVVQWTKDLCGAVAVSFAHDPSYRDRAIQMFIDAGITTNIHYILSTDSIVELITRLKSGDFNDGIANVIILTYKPIGLGTKSKVITTDNPHLKELAELIENNKNKFGIGVDACLVPFLLNYTSKINKHSITSCDASLFSAYVAPNEYLLPCSMDVQNYNYAVDISSCAIIEAWKSDLFKKFRSKLLTSCILCKDKKDCKGGCWLIPEISICNRKERYEN